MHRTRMDKYKSQKLSNLNLNYLLSLMFQDLLHILSRNLKDLSLPKEHSV